MTLTHLLSLYMVVFIPAFFPMQGVMKPTLFDWLAMFLLSLMSLFGFYCFSRGIQHQAGSGKAVAVFSVALVGVVLAELLLGGGGFAGVFWGIVGAACIIVATVFLFSLSDKVIGDAGEYL